MKPNDVADLYNEIVLKTIGSGFDKEKQKRIIDSAICALQGDNNEVKHRLLKRVLTEKFETKECKMIYLDIDGILVDFYGTAKKFGVELEHNKFGVWCWYGSDKCELCKDSSGALWDKCHLNFPTPAEFYAVADLQPWFSLLWIDMILTGQIPYLLSKDYAELKLEAIKEKIKLPNCDCNPLEYCKAFDAPDKSVHCKHPTDLLIDDNPEECERWRQKGGIAYWFNLAEENPFEKFLKWWRLK